MKVKTLMTALAFALAIGGAFGFKSFNHSQRFTSGWESLGPSSGCNLSFIPGDCGFSGTQICTITETYYQDSRCVNPYYFSGQ